MKVSRRKFLKTTAAAPLAAAVNLNITVSEQDLFLRFSLVDDKREGKLFRLVLADANSQKDVVRRSKRLDNREGHLLFVFTKRELRWSEYAEFNFTLERVGDPDELIADGIINLEPNAATVVGVGSPALVSH